MAEAVNLTIGGYVFTCVPLGQADLSDVAAVYVLICVAGDGTWKVLDIGQAGQLENPLERHDREECWHNECSNDNIWVCVHRMPIEEYTAQDRLERENRLRRRYTLPCGQK